MTDPIQYHCGPQNEFSLSFVTTEQERLYDHLTQFTPPTQVVTAKPQSLTTPAYLVYSHSPVTDDTVAIPDHPFVRTMLRVFAGVVDGRREQGDTVRGNKSASLDEIPDVLSSRVDWKQPVPVVGGQLLSNLILSHSLPNANHRTSLGMLLVYLQSTGVEITARDLVCAPIDQYIVDSKRLLTIRRNTTKFRILSECGCTAIERKGGIIIPLSQFDLSVSNPYTHFATKHEQQSVQFVTQLLDDVWQETEDPGLQVFLSRLSSKQQ